MTITASITLQPEKATFKCCSENPLTVTASRPASMDMYHMAYILPETQRERERERERERVTAQPTTELTNADNFNQPENNLSVIT